jgi:hypothetical protein
MEVTKEKINLNPTTKRLGIIKLSRYTQYAKGEIDLISMTLGSWMKLTGCYAIARTLEKLEKVKTTLYIY